MNSSALLEPNVVEQAIRRSHCSNTGKEHACIGVCTITSSGITLDCQLCGKDKRPDLDVNDWLVDRASSIMHAAGMRFASLSTEAQREVLKEIGKDVCPNCKTIHFHTKKYEDYRSCVCGWTWYSRSGWRKPKELDANLRVPASLAERPEAAEVQTAGVVTDYSGEGE